MTRFRILSLALVTVAALGFGCRAASADTYQTFDLAWSGVPNGNTASATGTAVIDTTVLPDFTSTNMLFDPASIFQSLSITITGASSGNGTFTLADFTGANNMYWNTNGGTLNFNAPLIGQATIGSPWGTSVGGSGDFNLFSNGADPAAPTGAINFTLGANGGSGDAIQLTEFTPAPTPEPSSLLLLLSGILGLAVLARRRLIGAGVSRM